VKKILVIMALIVAPLVTHYGDPSTQNEGWTLIGAGGYETRGVQGWFVCTDQC
jgi:hypothetical protein